MSRVWPVNAYFLLKYRSSSVVFLQKPFPFSFSLRQHLQTPAETQQFAHHAILLPFWGGEKFCPGCFCCQDDLPQINYLWLVLMWQSTGQKTRSRAYLSWYVCLLSKTLTPNIWWVRKYEWWNCIWCVFSLCLWGFLLIFPILSSDEITETKVDGTAKRKKDSQIQPVCRYFFNNPE